MVFYLRLIAQVLLLAALHRAVAITHKIDAVVLTTGKDTRVFEKSIASGLKHLLDVDKFYIICPKANEVKERLQSKLGERVVFVDENSFPFNAEKVADVMVDAVKGKGLYPIDGKSPFEKALYSKLGWFLQQVLKLTAGSVLKLKDHVILDSDVVWFKDVRFHNRTTASGTHVYNYVSSSQYHPAYVAILKRISGVDLLPDQKFHRSGVSHHIVIAQDVMKSLVHDSEKLHNGLPFWQIALNQSFGQSVFDNGSALELTCRAPRTSICGAGSTLSEYELYFNYARSKFPQTVQIRPLMWANGPAPGLLYWPNNINALQSDGNRGNWLSHRQNEVAHALDRQISADKAQGYDYVGYHNYAKRRYFELVGEDFDSLCHGVPAPHNTTCSWNGYDAYASTRSTDSWFQGCACYMCAHPSYR